VITPKLTTNLCYTICICNCTNIGNSKNKFSCNYTKFNSKLFKIQQQII